MIGIRRSFCAAAVLSAAVVAGGGGAAEASTPWVYEETRLGGVAQSCDEASGLCAAAFCRRSGEIFVGLLGGETGDGARRADGYAVDGVAAEAEWFLGPGPQRRSEAWVMELDGEARRRVLTRLRRGLSFDATPPAGGDRIRFTLRGSSRAIGALEDRCSEVAARADAAGADLIARYQDEVVGRWGGETLCAAEPWRFGETSLSTPAGVTCLRLTVAPADGGALRVRGLLCAADGLPSGDVLLDASWDEEADALTIDFVASDAPTLTVARCPE